jgi:hypothetical protein
MVKVIVKVRIEDRENSRGRVYILEANETMLENFAKRRNRPADFYREYVLPIVRDRLELGEEVTFTWSQKCGCSCGCCPGFIVGGRDAVLLQGKSVYVTLKD